MGMFFLSFLSLTAAASDPQLYSELRFAGLHERAVLPSGTTATGQINPQRAVLGSEWFYRNQRLKLGVNLYESFHSFAPESLKQPQLWDGLWQLRVSDQLLVNLGRQALPIGRSDAAIDMPSVQPHSLTQLLGQSQFRADAIGLAYHSNLSIESSVASIGQAMDGRQRFVSSTRFSHAGGSHLYSLSLAYKGYSKDPFLVLVLEQDAGRFTLGAAATTGANEAVPFWGAEGRLSWARELSQGAFQGLRLSERTAYLSPSGALRDLESHLQSDSTLMLDYTGPCEFGLGYSLFYPINASIPIVHRAAVQLNVAY